MWAGVATLSKSFEMWSRGCFRLPPMAPLKSSSASRPLCKSIVSLLTWRAERKKSESERSREKWKSGKVEKWKSGTACRRTYRRTGASRDGAKCEKQIIFPHIIGDKKTHKEICSIFFHNMLWLLLWKDHHHI